MSRHDHSRPSVSVRTRIAGAAARLMAEAGVTDFGLAKRKAARQLGLPEGAPLPDNAEIEAELRTYQQLYLAEEQPALLRQLRQTALEVMTLLAPFNPYLTGAVLEGHAGRYADIELLLFADSAKEVEIFLLNRHISVEHAEISNEKAEAVLTMETEVATVRLSILDPHLERTTFRSRDGRIRGRAKLETVQALLAGQDSGASQNE